MKKSTSENCCGAIIIPGNNTHNHSPDTPPFSVWPAVVRDLSTGEQCYIQYCKPGEYREARNSILWIPLIRKVVEESIANSIVHPGHRDLFENILFGIITVETNGQFALTGNFGNTRYQTQIGSFRGLSQMVAEKHYLEENPYDPLTAIRLGMRNTAPFVYHAGNIEAAIAEHNNGKQGILESRTGVDAYCTIGEEFVMRVVNAAWWGRQIIGKKDFMTGTENYQWQLGKESLCAPYYKYSPPWDFLLLDNAGTLKLDEPDIPFNWHPPRTSMAYTYIQTFTGNSIEEKMQAMIQKEIVRNVWKDDIEFAYPVSGSPEHDKSYCRLATNNARIVLKGITIPEWFYSESICKDIQTAILRPFGQEEKKAFPRGCFGRTPAYDGTNHLFFLEDGDIFKDIIGRDRQGNRYCITAGYFRKIP